MDLPKLQPGKRYTLPRPAGSAVGAFRVVAARSGRGAIAARAGGTTCPAGATRSGRAAGIGNEEAPEQLVFCRLVEGDEDGPARPAVAGSAMKAPNPTG